MRKRLKIPYRLKDLLAHAPRGLETVGGKVFPNPGYIPGGFGVKSKSCH
jgi:hypothetical protein